MLDFNNEDVSMDMLDPAAIEAIATDAQVAATRFTEANRVAVVDRETLGRAVHVRMLILQQQRAITEKLAKPKSWAHNLHRWFCTLEASALQAFEELDRYEREEIRAFKAAEDMTRERQEREVAEAEHRRQQEEATAEAALLERAGETAQAAAVLQEAIATPPPVVVLPDVTKGVQGLKFRTRWLWRVKNEALVPDSFKCLDESKIGAYVRAMRGSGQIPGIDIYSVEEPVR